MSHNVYFATLSTKHCKGSVHRALTAFSGGISLSGDNSVVIFNVSSIRRFALKYRF